MAGFRADPELRFPKHVAKTDVEPGLVSEAVCNTNAIIVIIMIMMTMIKSTMALYHSLQT